MNKPNLLLAEVRQFIDAARQRVASADNAELTQLHCGVCLAGVFPHAGILHTLCSPLSWPHLRQVIQIDDPLKRDFYLDICRVERWSVRQLQERINSLLYEAMPWYVGQENESIRRTADVACRVAMSNYGHKLTNA